MALKKKLSQTAKENTTVTKGTSKEQEVLKEGVPNDHARKHLTTEAPTVGVSIGVTLNMQDYNSLRVDTWLTDRVDEEHGETKEKAYARITQIATKVLDDIVKIYREE